MRRTISALAAGAGLAIGATPAVAAPEPGFTVDPQSPAGVEYQIPLDHARNQGGGHGNHSVALGGGGSSSSGGGGSSGGSGGGSAAPLFGSGITPATGSSSGKAGKDRGGRNGGGASDSGGGSGGRPSLPELTSTASYSSTGPVAGVVAAIVLAGLGLGFFLRQRNRPRRIFS